MMNANLGNTRIGGSFFLPLYVEREALPQQQRNRIMFEALVSSFDLGSIRQPALVGDPFCIVEKMNDPFFEKFTGSKDRTRPPKHMLDVLRDFVKLPEQTIFSFFHLLYGELLQTILSKDSYAYRLFDGMKNSSDISMALSKSGAGARELHGANDHIRQSLERESRRYQVMNSRFISILKQITTSESPPLHVVGINGAQTGFKEFSQPRFVDVHCTFKFVRSQLYGVQALFPVATDRMIEEQGKAWLFFSKGLYHSMAKSVIKFELSFQNLFPDERAKADISEPDHRGCMDELGKLKRLVYFFRDISEAEINKETAEAIDIPSLIQDMQNWNRLKCSINARMEHCNKLAEAETSIDLPPDLPPIRFYRGLLEICCDELYLNALKYSASKNGKVKIRVEHKPKDKLFKFFFENNGNGVSEKNSEDIFKPGHGQGTGIGLALIKMCTERINGLDIRLVRRKNPTRFMLSVREISL